MSVATELGHSVCAVHFLFSRRKETDILTLFYLNVADNVLNNSTGARVGTTSFHGRRFTFKWNKFKLSYTRDVLGTTNYRKYNHN
jgi:hypothetical protein